MHEMELDSKYFEGLPTELLEWILVRIHITDFSILFSVCKSWFSVLHDDRFNIEYFERHLGDVSKPFRAPKAEGQDKEYTMMPKARSFFWKLRKEVLSLEKFSANQKVMFCCSKGYHRALQNLLDEGRKAALYFDVTLSQSLHIACEDGHLKTIEVLLDNGIDIESENYQHRTALIRAISYRQKKVVNLLLRRGASVLHVDSLNKRSPLHSAVFYGQLEVVKKLLGCDDNDENCNGNHARNDDLILKMIGLREKLYGQTATHISASIGNEEILNVLLDHSADIDVTDFDQWTPLHIACSKGHRNVVEVLLLRGADRTKLVGNSTAFDFAVRFGFRDIIGPLFVNTQA